MSATFPEIDHETWKTRLTKELKNKTWEEIQWQVSEYFSLEPLHEANTSGDLGYLSAFHEKWRSLKSNNKTEILAPSVGLKDSDKATVQTAETYGSGAWVDEFSTGFSSQKLNCYTRLWDRVLPASVQWLEFDPAMDSLVFGRKLPGFETGQIPTSAQVHIHAADLHQAGGSAVQELAIALLVAENYRRKFGNLEWIKDCTIHLAAGPGFWLEMCKFRAMRLLWFNFCDANNLKDQIGRIRGCSSKLFWSKKDPDINLIRHTVEAMAMILGGADEILIQPHNLDPRSGLDATRQSINIGHLALEESALGEFFDPASGSYTADMLTHKLAESAWSLFNEWNSVGFENLISDGLIQKAVSENAGKLKTAFQEKSITMVGVNAFPSDFATGSPGFPDFPVSKNPEFESLRPVFLDV